MLNCRQEIISIRGAVPLLYCSRRLAQVTSPDKCRVQKNKEVKTLWKQNIKSLQAKLD